MRELADELAAYGLPELLQHDDLHDGQVFVRDGRHLLMDWGDACISHPFFTLSVTLEGVIAWGLDDEEDSEDIAPYRDAYLEPFAEQVRRRPGRRGHHRDRGWAGRPRGQRARARATTSRRSPGCGCSSTAGRRA